MQFDTYARARTNMIEGQLRPNKVTDPALIEAFDSVPREYFVPDALRASAYIDEDLPLGGGRFLLEPMVLARLIQAAGVKPSDSVLEVGTGTGYGAAILAKVARVVVALEADPALAKRARAVLAEIESGGVTLVEGALTMGYAARAPYGVILVNGAVPEFPPAITDQLAEGGRLVGVLRPLRDQPRAGAAGPVAGMPEVLGHAVLVERLDGGLSKKILFEAGSRPLPGSWRQPEFTF